MGVASDAAFVKMSFRQDEVEEQFGGGGHEEGKSSATTLLHVLCVDAVTFVSLVCGTSHGRLLWHSYVFKLVKVVLCSSSQKIERDDSSPSMEATMRFTAGLGCVLVSGCFEREREETLFITMFVLVVPGTAGMVKWMLIPLPAPRRLVTSCIIVNSFSLVSGCGHVLSGSYLHGETMWSPEERLSKSTVASSISPATLAPNRLMNGPQIRGTVERGVELRKRHGIDP